MSQLPIDSVIDPLLDALARHSQLVLKAPPGAGKSTRLPQVLLERLKIDGKRASGKIVMLEPRRLAARNIASFLAGQLGETVGQTVGLRIRGETKVSRSTRLEIVTEGVMTRMIQSDPELAGIDMLIFDEFHERSIHADLALALALDVQSAMRDDLRLLVMSATLDDDALTALLPDARLITSEGRCYPVGYGYQTLDKRLKPELSIAKSISGLMASEKGSALVFLPGAGEINRVASALGSMVDSDVLICPLFGQLSQREQQQAIAPAPAGKRKVVLATNIAETSLTIEGIRLVIDAGLERVARFNRKTGITRLEKVQIAKSSAIQRAGRAGRLEPGYCLRLYSEDTFQRMRPVPEPEIVSSDLTGLVVELAQWGCDAEDLRWLDVPPTQEWQQAVTLLTRLGILDGGMNLTRLGHKAVQYGTDARLAAMLATASTAGPEAANTACWLAAWAEEPPRTNREPDLRLQLMHLSGSGGKHSQRAKHFANRLECRLDSKISTEWLPRLAALAWPDRIAQARPGAGGRYLLGNGHGAGLDDLHPMSDEQTLVAVDLMTVSQGDSKIFVACRADMGDLQSALPSLFHSCEKVDWDEKRGRLVAEKQVCCGSLIIERQPMAEPDKSKITEALVNAIRRKGLSVLPWNDTCESLLQRARNAIEWCPQISLPALDETALLADLENWLAPFMIGITRWDHLKKIDLHSALEAKLGWEQVKEINRLLPTHYQVPTGSRYKIRYLPGQSPVLAVRMQEMYGEPVSPAIAGGKIILVLELLSPAQRPLQITADLAGFWRGAYREVQKEMKGRYPKHVWPDDPASHIPTRKTKRHFQ